MKTKLFFIFIVFLAISALYGKDIPFSKQWVLFESLRITSAILFGVVGAWLGLVYPKALQFIIENKNLDMVTSMEDIDDVEILLKPLLYSSIILIFLLVLGPVVEVLHYSNINFNVSYVRAVSFLTLLVLSFIQVWAIVLTLVPINKIRRKFRNFKNEKSFLADIQINKKRKK